MYIKHERDRQKQPQRHRTASTERLTAINMNTKLYSDRRTGSLIDVLHSYEWTLYSPVERISGPNESSCHRISSVPTASDDYLHRPMSAVSGVRREDFQKKTTTENALPVSMRSSRSLRLLARFAVALNIMFTARVFLSAILSCFGICDSRRDRFFCPWLPTGQQLRAAHSETFRNAPDVPRPRN